MEKGFYFTDRRRRYVGIDGAKGLDAIVPGIAYEYETSGVHIHIPRPYELPRAGTVAPKRSQDRGVGAVNGDHKGLVVRYE